VVDEMVSHLVGQKGRVARLLEAGYGGAGLRAKDAESGPRRAAELLSFAYATQALGARLAAAEHPGAAFYRTAPGIVAFGTRFDLRDGAVIVRRGFDIIEHPFRVVADDPGAMRQLVMALGVLQTHLERRLALAFHETSRERVRPNGPGPLAAAARSLNVIDVFTAADRAGTRAVLLDARRAKELDSFAVTTEGKARMRQDLANGYLVLTPEKSVLLGGRPAIGWWRIDPATGSTLGVMESGEGEDTVEYGLLESVPKAGVPPRKPLENKAFFRLMEQTLSPTWCSHDAGGVLGDGQRRGLRRPVCREHADSRPGRK
jgi:hypothetical protein